MIIPSLDRRAFLGGALASVALTLRGQDSLPSLERGAPRAIPTPDLLAWQALEIGMFVHIAPNTWADKEGDDLSVPPSAIDADFDTENWADCAVNLGARYIVFVAKHEGGFCMWQTQTTKYGIAQTPWKNGKGDVMADLAASCRKRGLRLGVYLSPRDKFAGAGLGGVCKDAAAQQIYNEAYRQQLTEVLTRYGEMVEVWFDGSSVVPTSDLVRKYASHAALFQGPDANIRWVGNEMGFAPNPLWNAESEADRHGGVSTAMHGTPLGDAWVPVECDVSIRRPNWFWSTTNENRLMTLDQLVEVYYRSVGRGAQLLLNLPPNHQGRIAQADFLRAKEFGDEIRRRFSRVRGESSGSGSQLQMRIGVDQKLADRYYKESCFKDAEGRSSCREGDSSWIDTYRPARTDHVILQEDCRMGQRVRGFRIESPEGKGWKTLYEGSSIGHKRIVSIAPGHYPVLRLSVTGSIGEPQIARFAAVDAGVAAPATWDATPKVWADDAVGEWSGGSFEVDLTKKIADPATYRLRFVPSAGRVRTLAKVELLLDGAPAPHLVRSDGPDALLLTVTALRQKVVLRGAVEGAEQGTILLKRL
ncbi:MAG: alpha-L-fucosidase [Terracidiphilus sp.]|nr:alpha-L-fucosidase [Terracidiphilus sp.]